jgi:hypothetical protein
MYRKGGRSVAGGRRCTGRQVEVLQEDEDVQGSRKK